MRKHQQQRGNQQAVYTTDANHGPVQPVGLAHGTFDINSTVEQPTATSSGTSGATQLTPQDSDEGPTLVSSQFTRSSGPAMLFTPQETSSDPFLANLTGQAATHSEGPSDIMHPGEGSQSSRALATGTFVGYDDLLNFQNQPTNCVDPVLLFHLGQPENEGSATTSNLLSGLEMGHRQPELGAPNMQSSGNYSFENRGSDYGLPTLPRHMPGFLAYEEPWSPWRMPTDQLQSLPPSDTSLFADLSAGIHPRVKQSTLGTGPVTGHMDLDTSTQSSDDTLDKPPSGDPVGPPPHDTSPSTPQVAASSSSQHRKGGRKGPLNDKVKKNAKAMRFTRSCWHCVLMRGTCLMQCANENCRACQSMRKTSLITVCDRTNLPELESVFLPDILVRQHSADQLRAFCKSKVEAWTENKLTVYVTCGIGFPIKCDVWEIEPKDNTLLYQSQYRLNEQTSQYERGDFASPPIGMKMILREEWRPKLEQYIKTILSNYFKTFPDKCYRGTACEVQKDILRLLHRYYLAAKGDDHGDLTGLCLELVIVTYIMTHSWTLTENTKNKVFDQLWRKPSGPFQVHTCPRWLNKQLKYLMATAHKELMRKVLAGIQDKLHLSNKKATWATVFVSLLMLSMTTESLQVAVRGKEAIDKREGILMPEDGTAQTTIDKIEERLNFLIRLYRKKYGATEEREMTFNPLKEGSRAYADLGSPDQSLAREMKDVIDTYRGFLETRQSLSPPLVDTEPQYSRLVAKFLLCH